MTYGSRRAHLSDFDLGLDAMGGVIPWKVLQPQESGRVISIMGEAPDGLSAERGGEFSSLNRKRFDPNGASMTDRAYLSTTPQTLTTSASRVDQTKTVIEHHPAAVPARLFLGRYIETL